MSMLKGSTNNGFDRNIIDIHHRLSAFSTKRYGTNSNLTHSKVLSSKRSAFSKDFAKFIISKYQDKNEKLEKLNYYMDTKHIKEFIIDRTKDHSRKTAINYVSSFSSMISGLKQVNIDIEVEKSIFDNLMAQMKDNKPKEETRTNRAIENIDKVLEDIKSIDYSAFLISKIQLLGYRVSESWNVVNNIDKHYNSKTGMIENVIGKGSNLYAPKKVNTKLVTQIKSIIKVVSIKTYGNILKKVGSYTSHDLRYTFAKMEFEKRLKNGENYHKILKSISVSLNHKRENITLYYLKRA